MYAVQLTAEKEFEWLEAPSLSGCLVIALPQVNEGRNGEGRFVPVPPLHKRSLSRRLRLCGRYFRSDRRSLISLAFYGFCDGRPNHGWLFNRVELYIGVIILLNLSFTFVGV